MYVGRLLLAAFVGIVGLVERNLPGIDDFALFFGHCCG